MHYPSIKLDMCDVMAIEKTKGGPVYPVVAKTLSKLGQDISLARRTRRISAADFAERMGVSRATLSRLEAGDAGCSLNTLASALHILGRLDLLSNLLDQTKDDTGLWIMRDAVPKRIRKPKVKGKSGVLSPDGSEVHIEETDEGQGW